MDIDEIYKLRRQGNTEGAYEAARKAYATDKSIPVAKAMFWTAIDILKIRIDEKRMEEATKIYLALDRLLRNTVDESGEMTEALKKSKKSLGQKEEHEYHLENIPAHIQTGVWGEEYAAAYLRGKGYVIIERNWHSGHRDIDFVARHNELTVFVEVKTRRSRDYGEPEEAVNYRKQKNLLRAINHYMKYHSISTPCRFDVITIIGHPGCLSPEINHIEDFALNMTHR